jgi:hypothetical protein
MRKMFKYGSPGLVMGAIALVIALGGTSLADQQAQTAAKPKVKPKVTQVTQTATLPPQSTSNGILDVTVTCPDGTTVVGGGALDLRPPGSNLAPFQQNTYGPSGNGWRFQIDNDTSEVVNISLTATCLQNSLRVKGLK